VGMAPGVCCLRSGVGSGRVWKDGFCFISIFSSSALSSNFARLSDVTSLSLSLFLKLVLLGQVFSHAGQGGLILSSFAWNPPICLPSPPGDQVPLPLPPGAPCGGLLELPLISPLHRSINFKCGSWWSPFSVAVSPAWRMCLP